MSRSLTGLLDDCPKWSIEIFFNALTYCLYISSDAFLFRSPGSIVPTYWRPGTSFPDVTEGAFVWEYSGIRMYSGIYFGYSAPGSRIARMESSYSRMRIAPKQTLTCIIPIILIPDWSQTNAPWDLHVYVILWPTDQFRVNFLIPPQIWDVNVI